MDPFGGEGALEALRKFWGERLYPRRTMGHPARSRALAALHAAALDARALNLHRNQDNPAAALCDVELPQLEKLAEYLSDAWAGEDGWDTHQVVAAIKAAADKQEMPSMSGGGI